MSEPIGFSRGQDKILDSDGNELRVKVVPGGRFRLTCPDGAVTGRIAYEASEADVQAVFDKRRLPLKRRLRRLVRRGGLKGPE